EVGARAGWCVPRQGVGETVAVGCVAQRVLGEPALDRLWIGGCVRQVGGVEPPPTCLPPELVGRPRGDDHALPHDRDPIGDELSLAEDVSGDDQRRTALTLLAELAAHLGGGDWTETRGGC